MKAAALASFALVFAGSATIASAQGAGDKAAAEALFQEGLKLMELGKNAEACPKLAESLRIEPGIGVRMYLGECYERTGLVASAWAMFQEAASAARSAGQADREKTATERAARVERRVPRIAVTAASPAPGLAVKRDGTQVSPATFGTPIPVDPGMHVIEATAPGKRPWRSEIALKESSGTRAVAVPPLESADSSAPPPTASPSSWNTRKTLAVVAGGVGLAGVAVGTVFGIQTFGSWSGAKEHCSGSPLRCDPKGVSQASDANTFGLVSTIGFGVGAAGLIGGVALWMTAPRSTAPASGSAELRVGPDGVTVAGRF